MTIALAGEIDCATTSDIVAMIAEQFVDDGDLVIDAEALSFIDVAGCRVLVQAAESLGDGCKLVVMNAPSSLTRVLLACGWAEHPRIFIAPDTADSIGFAT
jgi:anti-anti-sigma factor